MTSLFARVSDRFVPRLVPLEVDGRMLPPVVLPTPGPAAEGAPARATVGPFTVEIAGQGPLGLRVESKPADGPFAFSDLIVTAERGRPGTLWLDVRAPIDELTFTLIDPQLPAEAITSRVGSLAAGKRIPIAVQAPVSVVWVVASQGGRPTEGWSAVLELGALRALQIPEPALARAVVAFLAGAERGLAEPAPPRSSAVEIRVTSGPSAGKTVRVEGRDRVVIGRSPTATLALDDERASRNHCLIEIDPPRVWVQDLGSRNGTLLADGGAPIQGTVELSGPSQLLIGQSVVAVNVPQATAPRSIRCGRCGNKAPPEVAAEDASAAWVCAMCRTAILDEPIVHPDFEVVRELGRGGMGAVLLAKHKRTGEPRALKVILPQAALSDRARKMFIREAEVQKRLDHPNIVRVDELREVAPGIFCMVMELVEGDDAGTLLERHGPLDPRWVAYLGFHAAAGLAHAHGLGIVHRDIKEDNLLVTRENAVKVADFGLAKSYETSGLSGFTRHGDMAGTLPYMAPEQVTNFRDVKPPGDVYALGATLYRLVTGKFPIQPTPDGNMGAFLLRVLEEPMVPVAQRNPAVPAALAAIIERALDKDPLRRFPSAREMAAALQTM